MNQEKRVCAVFGDIGGAKEVVPALKILMEKGVLVECFVDVGPQARAGQVLEKEGFGYKSSMELPASHPNVIIVGTSVTAVNAQILWTEYGREAGIPVIWVEDLWGTAGSKKVLKSKPPDIICTLDAIGVDMAERSWPGVETRVVGKPSFEFLVPLLKRADKISANVYAELGTGITSEETSIITYWSGGNHPRVEPHLRALQEALPELGKVIYIPRLHPKLPDDLKLELRELAFESEYAVDGSRINPDELTITSSINVGEWAGTGMYISALAGKPAVMCLFPECLEERLERGYPNGIPPLISSDAGWAAETPQELGETLKWICKNRVEAEDRVRECSKVFKPLLEPGAAERIANVIRAEL